MSIQFVGGLKSSSSSCDPVSARRYPRGLLPYSAVAIISSPCHKPHCARVYGRAFITCYKSLARDVRTWELVYHSPPLAAARTETSRLSCLASSSSAPSSVPFARRPHPSYPARGHIRQKFFVFVMSVTDPISSVVAKPSKFPCLLCPRLHWLLRSSSVDVVHAHAEDPGPPQRSPAAGIRIQPP